MNKDFHRVFLVAWPIIVANSTAPLLGLVDTAVIGHLGRTADLGAVALGALVFSFVYWSFGFLRMGTSGAVAMAHGAGDHVETGAVLIRALILAIIIGALMILLQSPIAAVSLSLLGGSETVEMTASGYIHIRIWGAPAALAMFALMGYLVGMGRSGVLLGIQLLLNGLNMALDIFFAGYLNWGVNGIAMGTVLAEWLALLYAAVVVRQLFKTHQTHGPMGWRRILDRQKLLHTLAANTNLFVRTLLLLIAFGVFVDKSARFGDTVLAANHILLQFISFSAFFLDGFAFATESLAGRAAGAGDRGQFDRVVIYSGIWSAMTALFLCVAFFLGGDMLIAALTDIDAVQRQCRQFMPYAGVYILFSFAAFQLDGVFIGCNRGREMRNASIASALVFFMLVVMLIPPAANHGLWLAFILFVIARAAALLSYYPGLRKSIRYQR